MSLLRRLRFNRWLSVNRSVSLRPYYTGVCLSLHRGMQGRDDSLPCLEKRSTVLCSVLEDSFFLFPLWAIPRCSRVIAFAVRATGLRGTIFLRVPTLPTSGTHCFPRALVLAMPEAVAFKAPHRIRHVRTHVQDEVFYLQGCRWLGRVKGQDPGMGLDLSLPPTDDDAFRLQNGLNTFHYVFLAATFEVSAFDDTLGTVKAEMTFNLDRDTAKRFRRNQIRRMFLRLCLYEEVTRLRSGDHPRAIDAKTTESFSNLKNVQTAHGSTFIYGFDHKVARPIR